MTPPEKKITMKNSMNRFACILTAILAATGTVVATAGEPGVTAAPPAKASPATPGWGFYPKWTAGWNQLFNAQLARTKQGDIGVIFLGDSLTHNWSNEGKAVWDEHFVPLKAVNYGLGGDSTRQVLWRLDHGLVEGLAPKLVVVGIGTNNIYQDYNSGNDAEVAAGIKAVVDAVRAKLPQAKVLVLGILPRQNSYFCDRIARINALVAKLDDGGSVRFLDVGAGFLEAPGKVKADLYQPDQVHLSVAGYQAFYAAIKPRFDEVAK